MNKTHHHYIAWICVFLLFVQNLLPLQTHTKLKQNELGELVTVCTLQGIKQVESTYPALPSIADNDQSQDQELPTAAVKFSTLIAETHLLTADIPLQRSYIKLATINETEIPLIEATHFRWNHIRAPPLA